jgi:hypothetical protein
MKPIPMILLVVGGVMIYAGVKGDNPLNVLKGVLTGGYTPKGTVASTTTTDAAGTPTSTTTTPPTGIVPTTKAPPGFGSTKATF